MAPHSSTLAWKIPWTEEPGGLQSMGSLRVRHDWATSLSLFTFTHWRRKWQPTPVFLPGESQGWGSLVGCRLWVAQGQTRLKQLNSSSSIQKAKIIIYAPTFPTWGNLVDLTWILSFRFFIPKITNNLIHQTIVELKLGTWSKQNALCLMNIKIYKSCTPCKLLHVF